MGSWWKERCCSSPWPGFSEAIVFPVQAAQMDMKWWLTLLGSRVPALMLVSLALNQFAERLARVTSCRCTQSLISHGAYKQAVPRQINPRRAHLTELGHSKVRSLRVLDNFCRVNLVRRRQRIHDKDEELWAMITSFFLFGVIITWRQHYTKPFNARPNFIHDSTHGHHKVVNTEIRLIMLFAAKDGKAPYSQQKQDPELRSLAPYCKI